MKILLAGGTGFIGRALIQQLSAHHTIILLTRKNTALPATPNVTSIVWDGCNASLHSVPEADSVINLAGENIAEGHWTEQKKRRILSSRTDPIRALGEIIRTWKNPPAVWLNASATGIYGDRADHLLTESSAAGVGFLAEVAQAWEEALDQSAPSQTRTIALRFGVVLGRGGMLARLTLPFRLGLGAVLGSGKQFFPWIHVEDAVRAIAFLVEKPDARGPFNIVAPDRVTLSEWTKTLGQTLRRPIFLRAPEFFLRVFLGERSSLFLSSANVEPHNLKTVGFEWRYPRADSALDEIFSER